VTADDGFLSRWARRKAEARTGVPAPEAAPVPIAPESARETPLPTAPTSPAPTANATAGPDPAPLPTLDDVARLTQDSDFSPYVARAVDARVRNAAMKKLFSDPHFNVMDGLDTYIDDYGKPNPIPPSMLRQMWQSKALGLFDDEEEAAKAPQLATTAQASPDGAAPAPLSQSSTEPAVPLDENPDLRLQPHDDPGRPGPDEGAGPASV